MRVKQSIVVIAVFLALSILVEARPERVSGQDATSDSKRIPSYLEGYEKLYDKDPHAAAVEWFKDAKFGLFVHYALASLLEGGKWEYVELIEKNGPNKVHQTLFREFKAEKFDADETCDLALAANMRYVTFTTWWRNCRRRAKKGDWGSSFMCLPNLHRRMPVIYGGITPRWASC